MNIDADPASAHCNVEEKLKMRKIDPIKLLIAAAIMVASLVTGLVKAIIVLGSAR